jgi:Kef-type K+ transport system membrane component KefB
MLFDINEAWHHMGILSADKMVDGYSILFGLAVTFVMAPVVMKTLDYLFAPERRIEFFLLSVTGMVFILLYLMKAYGLMAITALMIGFYVIVAGNPKYDHLKRYIDRYF